MCGVGVYISKKPVEKIELIGKLNAMNTAQTHRGPDYAGFYVSGNVGLSHTRLSIIDLSENANQPFVSPCQRFVASYNGELYNYKELRTALTGLGHTFKSQSDTEVALRSYMQWGTGCFDKFNGMFGIAIYDIDKNIVIVARDRLGIKFAHYYQDAEKIIFASEIKAVLQIAGIPEYRPEAVNDFIALGQINKTGTFFKNIYTLLPGKYCVINLSDLSMKTYGYFNLQSRVIPEKYIANKSVSIDTHADTLDKLLQESIEKHLIADIPVGTLCSGGVDSSLVTAIAKRIKPDIKIYHGGVEEGGGEEQYAQLVAQHLGLDINYTYISKDKYLNDLVNVVNQLESPCFTQNDISLYHICKLARSQGVKVLLSGESSDEFFAGYKWYPQLMRKTGHNYTAVKTGWKNSHLYTAGLFYRFAEYYNEPRLANIYALFANQGEALTRWNWILEAFSFLNDITEISGNAIILDNLLVFLNILLYSADRMGMMSSIENRFPFIENNLIDFSLNLPLEFKVDLRANKKILKLVAQRYLPAEIIERKKIGFPTPVESYITFNEDFFKNGFLENHLSTPAKIIGRTSADKRLIYRLATTEIWGRLFVMGENKNNIKELVQSTLNRQYQYIS